ncbi:uncharacterized protein LOC110762344 [Prunus avium]|uniref:Uncharacterized protein LOC110762344 n=1 Tax=Prunus avium TaxID=42229 RepID=A0A6P5SWH3_PRUAV|nr:uncharacterized protein LOC110762344 [Prunus avium]XP_021820660.1 uncharacterized protein LOC110762344 [Prunus avium]
MHQISEFLEMGAHIQCNSYFPGYFLTRNHNLIANRSKRKHNSSPDQFLGYYKEVLKQTMLEQEMILRDQIQDLHRLYGRQRELMDEIRRNELVKYQLKMEASQLTTSLSQSSSVCVQNTFHMPSLPLVNPVCNQIFVSGAESIQSPSCFVRGRNIKACSYSTQTEGRSGDCELLESNSEKFQKNFLDLELPADAYIDNEEEEVLGNGKVSEAHEASSSQALPCFNTPLPFSNSYKLSTVNPALYGDRLQLKKDFRSSTEHGSAFFLDSSFSNGSQLESKHSEAHPPPPISFDNLIRINDNLVSEHHGITKYRQDSANVKSPKDINLNFMPPSCPLDVAVSQSFQATTGSENLEDYNEQLQWHGPKFVYSSKTDKGREDSKQAEAIDHSSERICGSAASCEKLNISCDGCSLGSPSNANLNPPGEKKKREKYVVLDLNLACDSVLDTEIELTEHVVENEFDKKDVGFGLQVDLNSSINGDGFSPISSLSTEIFLEAPASPENKECSPPRGESDQNQVETPFLLLGQEDLENKECFVPTRESDENQIETPFPSSGDSGKKVDLEEELVRTAAESLASISSSGLHTCIVRTTNKLVKPSCDSLHWFAGIASAVVGGPENRAGVVMSEDLLPDGMDYFEVMTLNLTETKVEECCCRSNSHKDEETGTTSSPNQPRRGRKRRGKQQKDFQSEILPSLASLSRYEVTEDLQTLGGLVESSGNRLETGSARYGAKLGLARGRRRSSISTSTVTENTLESLLKQIGSKSEFGKEERRLIGWGEVTRRRRGQRFPVSKPRLILSQV